MASSKSMLDESKDQKAMTSILKDFGITDFEPAVLNQMLEFTYRYVTSIIDDAVLYSTHANKTAIDIDDVRLAITLQFDKIFASPPPREFTADLARQRNASPLSAIRSSAGLRLPPDRHSLTACNFHLKYATKKPRTVHTISRLNAANLTQSTARTAVSSPIMKFQGSKVPTPQMPIAPVSTASSAAVTHTLNNEVKVHSDMNSNKRPHEDDDHDN